MYEPVAHAQLNAILDRLGDRLQSEDLRHFYTRLGANFYAIHGLFERLYGERPDFDETLFRLVEVMARATAARPSELRDIDRERESCFDWFLHQKWVGMALYTSGFAGSLSGVRERVDYFEELGVNLLHLMPILECPPGASDGGYAVSNFRDVDDRIGSLDDLRALSDEMRARDMLLTLDVVLNHTSDEHVWAKRARAGDAKYQGYFYTYPDREVPDMFEESMPEIFPETAPGSFSWDAELDRWVMTIFNNYQWDLNYRNPEVLIEMLDIILFWANQGADILRLDAVAFLWKQVGTTCQNLPEAHLILQLLKDCAQVVAPGVLFIAEAIVAPVEITKYFGEDAVVAKECEIAYNATLMALLWDAMATRNAKLLNHGIQSLPPKLDRATWLNYARCHDDIGLGFDDADIARSGYDPASHRRFLVDYYTGRYGPSDARGERFGENQKTGDARIAGTLASLAGLEAALERSDTAKVEEAIRRITLLHSIILSFGGIPLLYYGDELGTLNNASYRDDPSVADDSRWLHRPTLTDDDRALREVEGSPAERIFGELRRLVALRKELRAFADYNDRTLVHVSDPRLFVYVREHPYEACDAILVVANFDAEPHQLITDELVGQSTFSGGVLEDVVSGESFDSETGSIEVSGYGFRWLKST